MDAVTGLIGLVVALLAWAIFGRSSSSSSSSAPTGTESIEGERPSNMPDHIWRWKPLVVQVAREIGYPFNPAWALATIWREVERTGSPSARGAVGEVGLMQMTQTALEDVRQNLPDRAAGLPADVEDLTSPRDQIKAGMLYQTLNARRCREHPDGQKECTIRAHNEGPPPLSSTTLPYWRDVQEKRNQIGHL